jgi:hypothetical protein
MISGFERRHQVLRKILFAILAALAVSSEAGASEATLATDVNSAYVWRGITFNDGPVLQPSIDVSGLKIGGRPLGINVWANMDLGDFDGALKSGEFSEVDFTLTLGLPAGFDAGVTEYLFPAGAASTRELTVSWSKELPVTPSLAIYYDFGTIDDYFATASLAREFTLNEKTKLGIEGLVGIAGDDFSRAYGGQKGGLYHYSLSGRLSFNPTEKISLGASLSYSGSFDKTEGLPDQPVNIHGGVSASLSF